MAGNSGTAPAQNPAQRAQTREEIVAALRAQNAKTNSAVWNVLRSIPLFPLGGAVDFGNAVAGTLAGKGFLKPLVEKPVGGLKDLKERFKIPELAPDDTLGQVLEAGAGMLSPGGASKAVLLLHGGPQLIKAIDPKKLGSVGAIQGPGFYTSDKLSIPLEYAKLAKERDPASGAISVFDFPDELIAKVLPLTEQPLADLPKIQKEVVNAISSDPKIYEDIKKALISDVKFMRQSGMTDATPESMLTGEWLNAALRKQYGLAETTKILSSGGLTGKGWEYSRRFPYEQATVVFPKYINELTPLGGIPMQATPAQTKLALEDLLKSLTVGK